MNTTIEDGAGVRDRLAKECGKFICSCGVYDDGECPRIERVVTFIRSEIKQALERLEFERVHFWGDETLEGYTKGNNEAIDKAKQILNDLIK